MATKTVTGFKNPGRIFVGRDNNNRRTYHNTTTDVTGGTATLNYSISSLVEGGTITINTDQNNFGSGAPALLFFFDLAEQAVGNMTLNGLYDSNNAATIRWQGRGNDGIPMVIDSTSLLPYNKGYRIGTTGGINSSDCQGIRIDFADSTEIFQSRVFVWPRTNYQNAANAGLFSTPRPERIIWQYKTMWWSWNSGNASDTNFFTALACNWYDPDATGSTIYMQNSYIASSNAPLLVGGSGIRYASLINPSLDLNTPLRLPFADEPYIEDSYFNLGPVNTNNGSWTYYATTTNRLIARGTLNAQLNVNSSGSTSRPVNHVQWPAYIRGYPQSYNAHMLGCDGYAAIGSRCRFRVAICENSDYFSSNKRHLLRIYTVTPGQITARLRGGWWGINNLSGKYICVIGDDGAQIGSVQIA